MGLRLRDARYREKHHAYPHRRVYVLKEAHQALGIGGHRLQGRDAHPDGFVEHSLDLATSLLVAHQLRQAGPELKEGVCLNHAVPFRAPAIPSVETAFRRA